MFTYAPGSYLCAGANNGAIGIDDLVQHIEPTTNTYGSVVKEKKIEDGDDNNEFSSLSAVPSLFFISVYVVFPILLQPAVSFLISWDMMSNKKILPLHGSPCGVHKMRACVEAICEQ